MKKTWLTLALAVLSLGTVLAGDQPAPLQLDLPTSVQSAMAVDPQVLSAQAGVDMAKANVQSELAKIAPGCTIIASHDQTPYTVMGGSEIVRSTSVTLTIKQDRPGLLPRLIGDKTVSAVEQALWGQADAEAQLAQARIAVATATIQKYLDVIEADELAKLSQSALELAKEDERLARASLEVGTVTRLDVLRAESNREKAALELQVSEENRRLASEALLLQIGQPLGTEVVLAPVPAATPVQPADLEKLTALALKARTEVLSKRTAVRKAESALAQSKNEALPSLSLSGTDRQGDYTVSVSLDLVTGDLQWSATGTFAESDRVSSPPADGRDDGLSLGLEFTWRPFDGGAHRAAVAAAEAGLESSRVSLSRAENEIRLELRQRLSALNLAVLRLAQARKEKDLAVRTRELAAVRFREGVGLFSDLGDASQALAQSEVSVVQAEHALSLARARLEQAYGGMPGVVMQG